VATAPPNVALWHKADMTMAFGDVSFRGNSGHWGMSALPPPKADIVGRNGDVRFVPKADIAHRKTTGIMHGSADEHDLAGRSGLKNLSVRASRFDEWQYFANNGAQSTVFKAGKEPGMDLHLFGCCNGPERERAN
jgi:hypothetical protein